MSSTTWKCAACTLENVVGMNRCAICGAAAPSEALAAAQTSAAPASSAAPNNGSTQTPWACLACTFTNSAFMTACEMCGTEKPAVCAPSPPAAAKPPQPAPPSYDEVVGGTTAARPGWVSFDDTQADGSNPLLAALGGPVAQPAAPKPVTGAVLSTDDVVVEHAGTGQPTASSGTGAGSGAGGAGAGAGGSPWVCAACTTANDPSAESCSMCNTWRAAAAQLVAGVARPMRHWRCGLCQMENASHATQCSVCGSPPPSESDSPNPGRFRSASTAIDGGQRDRAQAQRRALRDEWLAKDVTTGACARRLDWYRYLSPCAWRVPLLTWSWVAGTQLANS